MRTANQIGDDLEAKTQEILNGKRVPQSGGGKFFKCDVKGAGRFIWSCKATTKDYLRVTTEMIREVRRAAHGVIGTGDSYTPGMVVEVDGRIMVMLDIHDFAEIITAAPELRAHIPATKAQERLARARGLR